MKLISELYLQAIEQARQAFTAFQFAECQRFLTNALVAEPNDQVALALRDEVSNAITKAEMTAKEEEKAFQLVKSNARAQMIASLPWLDFEKVLSDCTDTEQIQYPVEMVDISYQTYRDSNGNLKKREVRGTPYTVMRTKTESKFNPVKFEAQYAGRMFRFNCPDKWSVSKVETSGTVIFKSGGFSLSPETIRATAFTKNQDALISLQKGQKVVIKGVLQKYERAFFGQTLYLEDAELLKE